MTKEEIIDLARQAKVYEELCNESFIYDFAKLVAEKERAKFCNILRQFHDTISLASDSNAILEKIQK